MERAGPPPFFSIASGWDLGYVSPLPLFLPSVQIREKVEQVSFGPQGRTGAALFLFFFSLWKSMRPVHPLFFFRLRDHGVSSSSFPPLFFSTTTPAPFRSHARGAFLFFPLPFPPQGRARGAGFSFLVARTFPFFFPPLRENQPFFFFLGYWSNSTIFLFPPPPQRKVE